MAGLFPPEPNGAWPKKTGNGAPDESVGIALSGTPAARTGSRKSWRFSGVEFELVKNPTRRSKRDDIEAKTGERLLPAIEFEDGTFLREESADMALP